ncbi:hypothetical protein ACFE04_020555 [Oxalis oulophora]
MRNYSSKPSPVVIVPPLYDFPPPAAHTWMHSPYNLLFGKHAMKSLFEDYFEEAGQFRTMLMLKPPEDPNADLSITVSNPMNNPTGKAQFTWQMVEAGVGTMAVDVTVSSSDPDLELKAAFHCSKCGLGYFLSFPLPLRRQRINSEDYSGVIGFRYDSSNLSVGTTFSTATIDDSPENAWLVSKMGRLSVGVQYERLHGSNPNNLKNWSCAIGYGVGSNQLRPSFNVGLELANSSQLIASFYQHLVVPRRVLNPLEESRVVGITNYIDVGFEMQKRVDGVRSTNNFHDATFQVAASWQANKNLLLKAKLGTHSQTIALAFKSWWNPSVTFNISATNGTDEKTTGCGIGIRFENLQKPRYERVDPNYVMITPNLEHLADPNMLRKNGKI